MPLTTHNNQTRHHISVIFIYSGPVMVLLYSTLIVTQSVFQVLLLITVIVINISTINTFQKVYLYRFKINCTPFCNKFGSTKSSLIFFAEIQQKNCNLQIHTYYWYLEYFTVVNDP